MNRKFRKLFKNPGYFFRDFFLKKYPIINCEQRYLEHEEIATHVAEKKLRQIENQLPLEQAVDIVYTWVNNEDNLWIKKKNLYIDTPFACKTSISQARFENHNELYYSVLSVRKYLPWVRNIYIVTDNQIPDWYNNNEGIYIVDHKDIIDPQYLPTFNSHVIEAHLHKIKGLAENFIYFNDDVMVARQLEKNHFFRKNGLASIFVSAKSLSKMMVNGITTATLQASNNSNEILKKKFDYIIDTPLVHTYVPLKKSIFKECYDENEYLIKQFLNNKYRGHNDINMATFLVPWTMYLKQKSIVTNDICYYFNIRSPHALQQYKRLLQLKFNCNAPHSFCVNDFKIEASNVENFEIKLTEFLTSYYLK